MFDQVKHQDRKTLAKQRTVVAAVRVRDLLREFKRCAENYGINDELIRRYVEIIGPVAFAQASQRHDLIADVLLKWTQFKACWTSEWETKRLDDDWITPADD